MADPQVFTSRLRGRPLLDSEGLTIGRIHDVVILPGPGQEPPRALGLVVTLQRRRIFVNLAEQLAELRELQPADLASAVEGLPPSRRDQIAACWPASASSAAPTWWRRCSRTTPRTCWPRCRPSSANGC